MSAASGVITQGTLKTADGRELPLESTEVEGTVAGPVADVVVRQRFRNTGSSPIEAVYLFPLPHEASVYRMCFRIEDRIVRAVVKEKAEARQVYERAKAEGRAATLLEEDRPSLFTLSVANIAPGAAIDVELAYQEVVAFDDGHFRFVFPMIAPEQYRDDAPAVAPGTLAPPRVPTGERAPDVALSVVVHATSPDGTRAEAAIETLRCVSHRTETEAVAGGGVRVKLPGGAPIANRDFVLTWQASGSGVRPRVHFERKAGEKGTFLLLVTPSEVRDDGRGRAQDALRALRCGNCGGTVTDMAAIKEIPGVGPVVPCKYCGAILAPGTEPVTRAMQARDVVILVDRSASMRSSFAQARRAALAVMSELPAGDGVQLFAFDHDRDAFDGDGRSFLAASPEAVAQAGRFLSGLGPRGGTEMEEAIAAAGKLPVREGRTRAIVLITDATIGNEGRLLKRIPAIVRGARLYVLGVGGSVDRRLVARLAQAGGGAHDVILPDEDVEVTLSRFARRVREGGPILKDLGVFWEGAGMADSYPAPVPDLFGGQPLHVLGRYDGVGPTRLVITGRTVHDKPYRQEIDVDLPAQTDEVPGLARLWARRHVEALATRVEAEPHRRELRDEALELSLRYSIVGPYTSLVAEDSRPPVKSEPAATPKQEVAEEEEEGAEDEEEEEEEEEEAFDGPVLRSADTPVRPGAALAEEDDSDALRTVAVSGPGREREKRTASVRSESRARSYSAPVPAAAPKLAKSSEGEALFSIGAMMKGDGAAGEAPSPPPGFGPPPPPAAFGAAAGPPAGAPPPPPPAPGFGPPPPPAAFGAPAGPPTGAPPPRSPGRAMPSAAAPAAPPPPAAARMSPPAAPPPPSPAPMSPSAAAPMGPPPKLERSEARGGFFSRVRSFFTGEDEPARDEAPPPPPYTPPPAPPPPPYTPPPAHGSPPFSPPESVYSAPAVAEPEPSAGPAAALDSAGMPGVEPPEFEPYPEAELAIVRGRMRGELDLVFLVDATGSMGVYISQVQRRLLELVEAVRSSPLCKSLRIGVVSYRDHPPQERSYVTEVLGLTGDLVAVRQAVNRLAARGGGDGPEAVTDGLFELVRLDWRPAAAKAVVWFGDAPPHGVEPEDDGFPEGCPCGHHWFTQAESCREMGIAVYAIGCYPTLGRYAGAEAVYRQVSVTSRGLFLPLRSSDLLAPIIVGAAVSELDRQRIDEHVADLMAEHKAALERTDEAERVRWLTQGLRERGVRPRGLELAAKRQRNAPLRFRDLAPEDIEGALFRLRALGRI